MTQDKAIGAPQGGSANSWAEMWPTQGTHIDDQWPQQGTKLSEQWPEQGTFIADQWPSVGTYYGEQWVPPDSTSADHPYNRLSSLGGRVSEPGGGGSFHIPRQFVIGALALLVVVGVGFNLTRFSATLGISVGALLLLAWVVLVVVLANGARKDEPKAKARHGVLWYVIGGGILVSVVYNIVAFLIYMSRG